MKNRNLILILALLVILATTVLAQQRPLAYDLRYQPKPQSLADVADGLGFNVTVTSDGSSRPAVPLAMTIRSIAPIDKTLATMDVAFENTGSTPYRFPVSLDARLLHVQGNTDRRSLLCMLGLSASDGGAAEIHAFTTYMSILDNNSWILIPPHQTLTLTFNADFTLLFAWLDRSWKQRLQTTPASGRLSCHETLYEPLPGKELERRYTVESSLLTSTNQMPVTMAP